jgi:hypothetical protein
MKRLGGFLRGIPPRIASLDLCTNMTVVVTPSKMAAYYEIHALEIEPYDFLSRNPMIVALKSYLTL